MRFFRVFLVVFISCSISACMYSDIKYPLDTDVNNTELGSKVGVASFQTALWLFAWGDAGTAAAAAQGNIKVIKHLDSQKKFIFFGAYSKVTTIAYGD